MEVDFFKFRVYIIGTDNRMSEKKTGVRNMIAKIKEAIFSQNGMRAINLLFILSLCLRLPVFTIAAYSLWIAYLAYSMKIIESRTTCTVYKIFIIYAAVIIAANIYFLFKAGGTL